jgi:DnaK suppressor protein
MAEDGINDWLAEGGPDQALEAIGPNGVVDEADAVSWDDVVDEAEVVSWDGGAEEAEAVSRNSVVEEAEAVSRNSLVDEAEAVSRDSGVEEAEAVRRDGDVDAAEAVRRDGDVEEAEGGPPGVLSTVDRDQAEIGPLGSRMDADRSLLTQVRGDLDDVDAALRRLDDGTYGRCEACGQPIGEQRLAAFPAARYCGHHQHVPDGGDQGPIRISRL